MQSWVSPSLKIRFELKEKELIVYRPDGEPFQTYVELAKSRNELATKAEKLAAKLRELGIDPDEI